MDTASASVFESLSFEFTALSSSAISSFAGVEGAGDVSTGGEGRCCSSSYSLISRFFNEGALFNVEEAGGDAAAGGELIRRELTGESWTLGERSAFEGVEETGGTSAGGDAF